MYIQPSLKNTRFTRFLAEPDIDRLRMIIPSIGGFGLSDLYRPCWPSFICSVYDIASWTSRTTCVTGVGLAWMVLKVRKAKVKLSEGRRGNQCER
jgi:hypothetical protein